ncbi:unnamed protein product [Cladocopium goreaui]|uniref:leucine--tRNA ligase n=1 Tax=Cladocopium goreaui TaxID=2562237 RepID=A0A9P1GIJ4_9DINO|nr:unnamed protein product [Cladocopium goreaui]
MESLSFVPGPQGPQGPGHLQGRIQRPIHRPHWPSSATPQRQPLTALTALPLIGAALVGRARHGRRSISRGLRRGRRVAVHRAAQDWTRRDQLLDIEKEMQTLWEEEKAYEMDAPEDAPEKYFVTFPFPYMNGKLHLGHAFSITKAEFAARFARLNGKRVLFPFGFHCTGMPIAAAALKLKECIAKRGDATEAEAEATEVEADQADQAAEAAEAAPGVFKGKKSKSVAKTGGLDQYDIMLALGIPEEEIPKFTDPTYWLEYFPPLAIQDMKRFGTAVDWRRTFITTDLNPYFDSFVQWHFQKLKAKYLANGKRQTIFSMTTQQPCADHDRAEGEGVNPQEYTLIKLRVKEIPAEWKEQLGDGEVYLVAATLRPETMYGQTNCFVLPEGEYGFFRTKKGEIFVCSQRSALNMYYQDLMEGDEKNGPSGPNGPTSLMSKTGQDLVGLPLDAPLCQYETIHVLPMFTISMSKGTGVVTSVPAEAPDDYVCLRDWKTRSNWREQYKVKEEWCAPDVVDILTFEDDNEDAGSSDSASAPAICEQMKIGSHREKDKLAAAKKDVYQKGFYSGIMNVGPYKGEKVADVKTKIRDELIEKGEAVAYFEPESKVVARSGDECVVALCEQWYLKYSDEAWTKRVREHVESDFEMFSDASKNALAHAVGWLGDWACSRTFGLGTKLPWDEQWLIESLSDSTIYMAYYTIAHLVESLKAEDLTEEVFDYVFCISETLPKSPGVPKDLLVKMRKEFEYWYPVDLRCSGKDLIQNHLTMSLFNHAAVWEDSKLWPRAFYCNGHVMVNSEKMSKSKGNFLTLEEAISTYSADATRIACADSGDGLQDANFSTESCGKTILRLTTLQAWAEDAKARLPTMRTGDYTFLDEIFNNEINICLENAHTAYRKMLFTDALRCVWYDLENLRSQYSILTNGDVHAEVVERLLESQTITLSPIAPHFCENLWRNVLKKDTLVVKQRWPESKEIDAFLARQYALIQGSLRSFRLQLEKFKSPKKKSKEVPPKPTHAIIFVAKNYKPWQMEVLKVLQGIELNEDNEPMEKNFMGQLREAESIKAFPKQTMKQAMPFASFVMSKEVKARGAEALELELPFDEAAMLRDLSDVIKSQLGVQELQIVSSTEEVGFDLQRDAATPAKPQIVFMAKEMESADT